MTLRKIDASRLQVPRRRFRLEPGTSNVPESIELLDDDTGFGHYDGEYLSTLGVVEDQLRKLFRCSHPAVFPVAGSGIDALEVILGNACEPGDRVLVIRSGAEADAILDWCRDAGLAATAVGAGDGAGPVPAARVAEAVRAQRPKVLVLVHVDAGSGVRQDPAPLRTVVEEAGCLLVADVGSTLGGQAVLADAWGLDGAYACVQRCLNCPPGLAVLTMSERLLACCRQRSRPVGALQPRLDDVLRPVGSAGMSYHPSAPIGLVFCLQAALGLCLAEGLENRWRRHADAAARLVAGLAAAGFAPAIAAADGRADTVVALAPPAGVEAEALRRALGHEFGIDVGIGEGATADGRWLVGLMGINATRPVVQHLVGGVDLLLGAT